ncbi:hypothetical protein LSTR_LSTR010308 [Laodelphax striatellus]|uniref:5'-nucleotidase n=1 Tax=Laodelphax striatellus TaxID=195883 RepID=A0A482WNW7_LAOST|nr:hypothetical protein LSTR_LSTR010308 [Laodelphax striatellus]
MSASRKSNVTAFWRTLLVASSSLALVSAGLTGEKDQINSNRNESTVFRLTVIHINDMHSRFEQVNSVSNKCATQDAEARNCYGGFARVRSASRTAKFEAQRAGRSVLFLNAGDTYQGTPYYNLFKWKVVAPFVEKMGFDAMALGNHEFDDGPDGLHPYLQNISAPTLACNLDLSDQPSMNVSNLKSSIMFNFTNFKVGVVGYLTPETAIVAKPERVKFLPEIPEIQRETDKLRQDGANIVIALGHSGIEKDKQIAEQVEGIDLVIGGHSHSLLHNGTQPSTEPIVGNYPTVVKQKTGKEVLVLQAYAFTKYLGIINLDYSSDGKLLSYEGNTKLLDSSVEEDVEILEELEPWRRVIDKKSHTKLGKTKVFLDAGFETRKGESLKVEFDINNPPGSRVVKLLARCSECLVPEYLPVEMEKEYGILTTTYLADGGDGFQMFKNNHSSILPDKDTDIVTEYLKRLSPIYPAREGRIIVKNFDTKDEYSSNEISGAGKQRLSNSVTAVILISTSLHILQS